MIVGVFLVRNDVAGGLGAVRQGIFIHMNEPILDLNEVVGIVAFRISQDDVPAVEVGAIKERGPTLVIGGLDSKSLREGAKGKERKVEKESAARRDTHNGLWPN